MTDLASVQAARRKQIEEHAAALVAEDLASREEGVSVVQWADDAVGYDQPFETVEQEISADPLPVVEPVKQAEAAAEPEVEPKDEDKPEPKKKAAAPK